MLKTTNGSLTNVLVALMLSEAPETVRLPVMVTLLDRVMSAAKRPPVRVPDAIFAAVIVLSVI